MWFLVAGFLMIVLGRLASWTEASLGTLPPLLGWSIISFAVVLAVLAPISGWPLVATSGVLLLRARSAV